MDALQALLSRVSPARLAPDEPDPLLIEQILAAGLRAADFHLGKLFRKTDQQEQAVSI